MKKTILLISVLIIYNSVFSQDVLTKQDYLKKSKSQKTTAIIIAGVGAAVSFTGILLGIDDVGGILDPNDRKNTKAADVLIYTGLVIMAGSIPFLIASSKNKKKALSVSFNNQMLPQFRSGSFAYRAIPSLNFKISL